jgi:hypothetical protein
MISVNNEETQEKIYRQELSIPSLKFLCTHKTILTFSLKKLKSYPVL